MKYIVVALAALFCLPSFRDQARPDLPYPGLSCTLTVSKTRYKTGEVPALKVSIVNQSGKEIYLVGSLDGSDLKWRRPYCYFTIEKPAPGDISIGRCGNMNRLRAEDFVRVGPGEAFDPYQSIDHYGFFRDYTIMNPETFKATGIYKIKFHYSTNSSVIDDFTGDRGAPSRNPDSLQLLSLFEKVPKVDLVSNEIEIVYEN